MSELYNATALAQKISKTVQDALTEIQDISPDTVIYTDSGWTVKDIIGHLLVWDEHTLKSLQAYHAGSAYNIPNYTSDDEFNHQNREALKDQPAETIYARWSETGEDIAAVVQSMSPEELSAEMIRPAGNCGVAGGLIHEIYEHTELHMGHIRTALS